MGVEAVLLSCLATAIARASPAHAATAVPLTMITPQRDCTEDAGLVGLLADQRHLDLRVSQSVPLLEVLLAVSQGVRQRLWRAPEPLAQPNRVLVNVLPLPDGAGSTGGPFELVPYDIDAALPRGKGGQNFHKCFVPILIAKSFGQTH